MESNASGDKKNAPLTDESSTEEHYDEVSYVISSRYRIVTIRELDGQPATPTKLASKTDLSVAHISRALQELRDHNLVELLVSEDRKKGRIYGLTDGGEAVSTEFKENEWI